MNHIDPLSLQERIHRVAHILGYFKDGHDIMQICDPHVAMRIERAKDDPEHLEALEKEVIGWEWTARKYVDLMHRQNEFLSRHIFDRLKWFDKKLFTLMLKLQIKDPAFIRVRLLRWYFKDKIVLLPFDLEGVSFPGQNVKSISIYGELAEEIDLPFFGGDQYGYHTIGTGRNYISQSDKVIMEENQKAHINRKHENTR